MAEYTFSKLVPGGNPTIILEDPILGDTSLAELSVRLMSSLHIGGEQVGALYSGQADEWSDARPDWQLPRLDMMGGEFCVNAARAAAFILARQGSLGMLYCADTPVWSGKIIVSGAGGTVRVLVSPDKDKLRESMRAPGLDAVCAPGPEPWTGAEHSLLFCAARVRCGDADCQPVQQGAWRVSLPGITHLLVDSARYPVPNCENGDWRKESEALRLMAGLKDEEASGVVWCEHQDGAWRIWPAVAVQATGSEHLESACGSASLALALALRRGMPGVSQGREGMEVLQPSGKALHVLLEDGERPARAWVGGEVALVAHGSAYL